MPDSPARRTLMFNTLYHARQIAAQIKLEEVLTDLGLIDTEAYINFGTGETDANGEYHSERAYLTIEPRTVSGIGIFMRPSAEYNDALMPEMEVTEVGLTLSDIARLLLPKVGSLDKSFDSERNLLQLHAHYKGVHIIVQDTPPETCTVERVETEVEVPEKIIPAHTKKNVSYKMVGDCDPIMRRS